ncbi:hypothetical protein K7432_011046 [Basidiobolus ranarum]
MISALQENSRKLSEENTRLKSLVLRLERENRILRQDQASTNPNTPVTTLLHTLNLTNTSKLNAFTHPAPYVSTTFTKDLHSRPNNNSANNPHPDSELQRNHNIDEITTKFCSCIQNDKLAERFCRAIASYAYANSHDKEKGVESLLDFDIFQKNEHGQISLSTEVMFSGLNIPNHARTAPPSQVREESINSEVQDSQCCAGLFNCGDITKEDHNLACCAGLFDCEQTPPEKKALSNDVLVDDHQIKSSYTVDTPVVSCELAWKKLSRLLYTGKSANIDDLIELFRYKVSQSPKGPVLEEAAVIDALMRLSQGSDANCSNVDG